MQGGPWRQQARAREAAAAAAAAPQGGGGCGAWRGLGQRRWREGKRPGGGAAAGQAEPPIGSAPGPAGSCGSSWIQGTQQQQGRAACRGQADRQGRRWRRRRPRGETVQCGRPAAGGKARGRRPEGSSSRCGKPGRGASGGDTPALAPSPGQGCAHAKHTAHALLLGGVVVILWWYAEGSSQ